MQDAKWQYILHDITKRASISQCDKEHKLQIEKDTTQILVAKIISKVASL